MGKNYNKILNVMRVKVTQLLVSVDSKFDNKNCPYTWPLAPPQAARESQRPYQYLLIASTLHK